MKENGHFKTSHEIYLCIFITSYKYKIIRTLWEYGGVVCPRKFNYLDPKAFALNFTMDAASLTPCGWMKGKKGRREERSSEGLKMTWAWGHYRAFPSRQLNQHRVECEVQVLTFASHWKTMNEIYKIKQEIEIEVQEATKAPRSTSRFFLADFVSHNHLTWTLSYCE